MIYYPTILLFDARSILTQLLLLSVPQTLKGFALPKNSLCHGLTLASLDMLNWILNYNCNYKSDHSYSKYVPAEHPFSTLKLFELYFSSLVDRGCGSIVLATPIFLRV